MKYKNESCNDDMTFEECELAILRHAVDETENIQAKKIAMNPDIKKIITILENFLKSKPLICYGGTAINNILPKQDQFYNKDLEIPDYDFYSKNALDDAIELANLKRGLAPLLKSASAMTNTDSRETRSTTI